jgi:hypothetical protein
MDGDDQLNKGQINSAQFGSVGDTHVSQQQSNISDIGYSPPVLPIVDQTSPNLTNSSGTAELQRMVLSIPQEANDSDLIEKEWVSLIEEVVAHTSEDPYAQQAEISKIKADYLQKRYGKSISGGA